MIVVATMLIVCLRASARAPTLDASSSAGGYIADRALSSAAVRCLP